MARHITRMTLEEADHYTPQQREEIVAAYPEHERDARAKGIPTLGSGRVFPLRDDEIMCEPLELARHWPRINGLDFGWDHPFAAVACAWDRDADVWYVTATYREKRATPVIHAASIKPWGAWIPCAWPHDGLQHDKGSGNQLAALYRDQGVDLLPEHATHEDGGTGVEAGVIEMLDRMQTGRFKVFSHLADWMSEFRLYHRKDGRIVKEHDDLISAARYGIMMKRFAKVEPMETKTAVRRLHGSGAWMGG
jgi:hypothetical protein